MTYTRRIASALLLAAASLALGACASATRPAGPEQPRAGTTALPYAVLAASDERRAAALAGWKAVLGEQAAAAAAAPELRPVTATLAGLPAGLSEYPRLPFVNIEDEQSQSEEETRESLRRFLAAAAPLLGFDPKHLSLVEVSDAPAAAGGGARRALYRQTPFAYPLRNGYGRVEVVFTPDRRIVGLSSTAVPEAASLARALAAVQKTLTAEQAVAALANRAVTYADRAGAPQTRTLTQTDAAAARELVVFPLRSDSGDAGTPTLELHVAWEVAAGGAQTPLLVYVDAATGAVLGAEESQK